MIDGEWNWGRRQHQHRLPGECVCVRGGPAVPSGRGAHTARPAAGSGLGYGRICPINLLFKLIEQVQQISCDMSQQIGCGMARMTSAVSQPRWH